MSMIGLKLLAIIDFRLREIRPQFNDKPVGGVTVVLFGDFSQLPPVANAALYQFISNQSPTMIQHASKLYHNAFIRAFNLTQQMRQQGQTEMDLKFQTALSHLRMGTVTREYWEFFQSRILTNLSQDDQAQFQDSIILFNKNDDVLERNIVMLEKIGSQVA